MIASIQWYYRGTFCLFLAFAIATQLHAAPRRYNNGYQEDSREILYDIRSTLESLKHEIYNHEAEIRTFEEKFNTQDITIDALQQQLSDTAKANRELTKNQKTALEAKISGIEQHSKEFAADIQELKTHANDTRKALSQYEEKLKKLEKLVDLQTQNASHLETALTAIAEALQIKLTSLSGKASADAKTYKVKKGDTLEKIAHEHHTTIKAIKELNNLTKDRIIVGQVLQIP